MDTVHFVYPFITGHLGCSHLLAIVNNAAMNRRVQNNLFESLLSILFLYFPRSGNAGSDDNLIYNFFFEEMSSSFPLWFQCQGFVMPFDNYTL